MTQFKDALEIIEQDKKSGDLYYGASTNETIRLALLIADRLMQEPSEGEYQCAAYHAFITKTEFKNMRKAMAEQMVKECGDAM